MLSYPEITPAICWSSFSRDERMITCLFLFFFFFSWDKMNLIFFQIFAVRLVTQRQARITYQLFLNQTLILLLLITFCTRRGPFCISPEDSMCQYVIWDPRTEEAFCLSLRGYRTFEAKTPRLWNNLLDEIRSDESMSSLKSLLKAYLYHGECPNFIWVPCFFGMSFPTLTCSLHYLKY